MCGGLKDSDKTKRAKDAQIAAEMKRLVTLRQGWVYTWPLASGYEKRLFGGHCRIENLDSVWNGKIEKHVKIEASQFSERDTIGGSKELKPFSIPDNKAIHAVIVNNELRIVTQPSIGEVMKVHHRMPHLVDLY
jgi:hypothetical protein